MALGRAISIMPKLLLLDEPGAVLSPVNFDKFVGDNSGTERVLQVDSSSGRAQFEGGHEYL